LETELYNPYLADIAFSLSAQESSLTIRAEIAITNILFLLLRKETPLLIQIKSFGLRKREKQKKL